MSWDERGVADPYVVRIEPYFYLYYLGQDRARRQRLGVARSGRRHPLGETARQPGAGTGRGRQLSMRTAWASRRCGTRTVSTGCSTPAATRTENRRLGLARSTDGVHWRKLPAVFAAPQPWDSKVICDPTVLVEGDAVRVWFGGGDVASPDENLHGQIGYGVLRRR